MRYGLGTLKLITRRATLAAAALLASCDGITHAPDVRLLLGAAPGGSSDRFTRLIAAGLARVSGRRVIVENEPRAAGLLAVDRLFRADPDGRTIGFIPSALIYEAALGQTKRRWRIGDFGWVTGIGADDRILIVNRHVTEDFAALAASRRRINIAANTLTSTNYIETRIVAYLTGAALRPVPGYDGGARSLAFVSGEVDGAVVGLDATKPLLEVRGSRIVLKLNTTKTSSLTGVPELSTFAIGPDTEQLMSLITQTARLGRLFALPPGCPPAVLNYWRSMASTLLSEPEFQAGCAAQGFALDHVSGADIERALASLTASQQGAGPALARALAMVR